MSIQSPSFNNIQMTSKEDGAFSCLHEECKRTFSSKRNLTDHFRSHHQGTRPHVCTYPHCGKSFLRPAHLAIHYRIHTGEKPFECGFPGCGKRWNQKSALKQHMRSHTGEKPFPCSVPNCTKRFSTSSSCKRHVLTHAHRAPNSSSEHAASMPSSPASSFVSSPNSCSFNDDSSLQIRGSNNCSPSDMCSNDNMSVVVVNCAPPTTTTRRKRSADEFFQSSDQEPPQFGPTKFPRVEHILSQLSVAARNFSSPPNVLTSAAKMNIEFLLN